VGDLALKEPELSPRELATVFVGHRQYFVFGSLGLSSGEGTWVD
jgi:hypothetical protein